MSPKTERMLRAWLFIQLWPSYLACALAVVWALVMALVLAGYAIDQVQHWMQRIPGGK
jgi:ABC-type nickel/cobalt efflux system permease component RcnA